MKICEMQIRINFRPPASTSTSRLWREKSPLCKWVLTNAILDVDGGKWSFSMISRPNRSGQKFSPLFSSHHLFVSHTLLLISWWFSPISRLLKKKNRIIGHWKENMVKNVMGKIDQCSFFCLSCLWRVKALLIMSHNKGEKTSSLCHLSRTKE